MVFGDRETEKRKKDPDKLRLPLWCIKLSPTKGDFESLLIAEKPDAAKAIADALSLQPGSRKIRIKKKGKPAYWIVEINGSKIAIVSSIGHLFTPSSRKRGFPVYTYEWTPIWVADRKKQYTRKYFCLIKSLSKRALKIINACDYDDEKSLIGYMIIKKLGALQRAYRMKYSTLVSEELVRSYNNMDSLDLDNVMAAITRHELDWLWGINSSRMLMKDFSRKNRIRKDGALSAGRVQSPALKHIIDSYLKAETHITTPFFIVEALMKKGEISFKGIHENSPFDKKSHAQYKARILRKAGEAIVQEAKEIILDLPPPKPFNLYDLQSEASRILGLPPEKTLAIAERLYLKGLISYPRTRSQRLPSSLDNKLILDKLARKDYKREVEIVYKSNPLIKPPRGGFTDPAHPAIYPTGNVEKKISNIEQKLLDLITRRYIASFSEKSCIKQIRYRFEAEGEKILVETTNPCGRGWTLIYPPTKREGRKKTIELKVGEKVSIVRARALLKHPERPPYPTKIGVIRWMEKNRIGTPATRTRTIIILLKRGYVVEKRGHLIPTHLGIMVEEHLRRRIPNITSTSMTREFEKLIEKVRKGEASKEDVIGKAIEEIETTIASHPKEKVFAKNRRKCLLCDLPEYKKGLCIIHYTAQQKLQNMMRFWMDVLETRDMEKVYKAISNTPNVGSAVKEVATKILLNKNYKDKK